MNAFLKLELLGRRDPFYDRRGDPYMDQREYGRDREREMFRERPPLDYDRDRLERERYSRDERCESLCMHFYSMPHLLGIMVHGIFCFWLSQFLFVVLNCIGPFSFF